MQNQEDADRIARIQKRAQDNLALASMHPRMAIYETSKEEKEKLAKKKFEEPKKVFKANPIPDFEKLQKNFQDLLDAKRRSKKPTESKSFAFQETRVIVFCSFFINN